MTDTKNVRIIIRMDKKMLGVQEGNMAAELKQANIESLPRSRCWAAAAAADDNFAFSSVWV
jgi:hypothetical protein